MDIIHGERLGLSGGNWKEGMREAGKRRLDRSRAEYEGRNAELLYKWRNNPYRF